MLSAKEWQWEVTAGYLEAFRQTNPEVVLAEYGHMGVAVMEACVTAGVPLVVCFHGYDISKHDVLSEFKSQYQQLFSSADALVAGCSAMASRLVEMGAPSCKVITNYLSTVEPSLRVAGGVEERPPRIVVTGRFVEKKAPQLTLISFSRAAERRQDAQLVCIGGGPLLGACHQIARGLGIEDRVRFLGPCKHQQVLEELNRSRCFAQHSVVAPDGDREGTAISILEAAACGLGIVATRHEGIGETMIDGSTAILVDEYDVDGMAHGMTRLLLDPAFAGELGRNARNRVLQYFTLDQSIDRLNRILRAAVSGEPMAVVKAAIDSELKARTVSGCAP